MDLILLQPEDPTTVGMENSLDAEEYKNCIELISIHQGIKQQGATDISNSAGISERPIITELTGTKYLDKYSAKLSELCLRAKPLGQGQEQPTQIFILREVDNQFTNIMTMSLRDAMVSEIQFLSHPDDMPTEQFKLSFTEILWRYDADNEDQLHTDWSTQKNKPLN